MSLLGVLKPGKWPCVPIGEAGVLIMSRRSDFSEELADTICDLLASGESLVQICQREDFPHRATVLRWMASNAAFAAKVGEIPPDVARIVISSKQWRAAKLAPRRYGDKTTIESTSTVKVQYTKR